ncbi:MAG: hypothetical protein WKF79_07045 [Nocardioides sp.]
MRAGGLVYTEDRVRRLRTALGVAAALGAVCAVFAVLIGVRVDEEGAGIYATVLGVVAAGTILWSFVTWRLLAVPDRTAKRAVVLTGVLLLLFALPTVSLYGLGLMFAVLGLVTIFLALISEEKPDT